MIKWFFFFFSFILVVPREESSKLFSGHVNSRGSSGISGLHHKRKLGGEWMCPLPASQRTKSHLKILVVSKKGISIVFLSVEFKAKQKRYESKPGITKIVCFPPK